MAASGDPGSVSIRTVCRVRPLLPGEVLCRAHVDCLPADRKVVLYDGADPKGIPFVFDLVYSPDSTQELIYRELTMPIVEDVLNGFNCTVFAYGQTNSGKTFTMEGNLDNDVQMGIIPRAVKDIFSRIEKSELGTSVFVSHIEIYNEHVIDLLSEDAIEKAKVWARPSPLSALDTRRKEVANEMDAKQVPVASLEEVLRVMKISMKRRETASTKLNAQSSRSHSVFVIKTKTKTVINGVTPVEKSGKLYLVDLAGSENAAIAGTDVRGARREESKNINKSLLSLGRVLEALASRDPFVPFRNSKLTSLLQESLQGNSKTCLIATLSPVVQKFDTTKFTLEYAARASQIKTNPRANETSLIMEIDEKQKLIDSLRRAVSSGENGAEKVFLTHEEYAEYTRLKSSEGEMRRSLEYAEERNSKLQKELNERKRELETTKAELERKTKTVESQSETIVKQEQRLRKFKQAGKELSENYRLAVSHVDALQKKVTELTEADVERKRKIDAFRDQISRKTAEVTRKVTAFTDSHKKEASALEKSMSAFAGERAQEFANAELVINQLAEEMKSLSERVFATNSESGDVPEARDALLRHFGTIADVCRGLNAKMEVSMTKTTERMKELSEMLKEHSQQFHDEATVSLGKWLKLLDEINTFGSECVESVKSICHSLSEATEKAQTAAKRERDDAVAVMNTMCEKQETLAKDMQKEIMRAVSDSLARFISQQSQNLRGGKTSVQSHVDALHNNVMGGLTKKVSDDASRMEESMNNLTARIVDPLVGQIEPMNSFCHEIDQLNSELDNTSEESIVLVGTMLESVRKAMAEADHATDQSCNEAKEKFDFFLQTTSQTCSQVSSELAAKSSNLGKTMHTSSSKCSGDEFHALFDTVGKISSHVTSAVSSLGGDMEAVDSESKSHLALPPLPHSGKTPKRVTFSSKAALVFEEPDDDDMNDRERPRSVFIDTSADSTDEKDRIARGLSPAGTRGTDKRNSIAYGRDSRMSTGGRYPSSLSKSAPTNRPVPGDKNKTDSFVAANASKKPTPSGPSFSGQRSFSSSSSTSTSSSSSASFTGSFSRPSAINPRRSLPGTTNTRDPSRPALSPVKRLSSQPLKSVSFMSEPLSKRSNVPDTK